MRHYGKRYDDSITVHYGGRHYGGSLLNQPLR
jgi:hypothetical protein